MKTSRSNDKTPNSRASVVYERVLRETGKLVRVTQNGRSETILGGIA